MSEPKVFSVVDKPVPDTHGTVTTTGAEPDPPETRGVDALKVAEEVLVAIHGKSLGASLWIVEDALTDYADARVREGLTKLDEPIALLSLVLADAAIEGPVVDANTLAKIRAYLEKTPPKRAGGG